MRYFFILSTIIYFFHATICSSAGFPQTLNYQGTLQTSTGQAITQPQNITFSLYTAPIGTESPFWSETLPNVPMNNGQISVTLGTVTPLDPSKFSGDTYLGVKVGAQAEMLPRQKMTSVPYAFNGIPKGGIIMWSGTDVPVGWALCDGNNGTPNLKDKFIVSAGDRFGNGKLKGLTGGEEDHALKIEEMPTHTHTQNAHNHGVNDPGHSHIIHADNDTDTPWPYGATGNNLDGTVSTNSAVTGISINSATAINQNSGGGMPHNNLPPYYALAFIMKL